MAFSSTGAVQDAAQPSTQQTPLVHIAGVPRPNGLQSCLRCLEELPNAAAVPGAYLLALFNDRYAVLVEDAEAGQNLYQDNPPRHVTGVKRCSSVESEPIPERPGFPVLRWFKQGLSVTSEGGVLGEVITWKDMLDMAKKLSIDLDNVPVLLGVDGDPSELLNGRQRDLLHASIEQLTRPWEAMSQACYLGKHADCLHTKCGCGCHSVMEPPKIEEFKRGMTRTFSPEGLTVDAIGAHEDCRVLTISWDDLRRYMTMYDRLAQPAEPSKPEVCCRCGVNYAQASGICRSCGDI